MAEEIKLDRAGAVARRDGNSQVAKRKNSSDKRPDRPGIVAHRKIGKGKDKKLKNNLKRVEEKIQQATLKAADAELLLENEAGYLEAEGELERTFKFRQDQLKESVDVETAKKGFELKMEGMGPYVAEYSRNGRHLLLAGRKGHVSTMDWREGQLISELQLGETIRDAKWLHNSQYWAVSQKKYVYVYDHHGVELHCMKKLQEVTNMEFLPYHFLLATVGNAGYLKYTDTSIGHQVIEMPTKQGTPTSMTQNPQNAIIHLGHQNGTVSLWSPNSTTPLVKLLAHRGPVRSLDIDREGRYMVSTGQDQKVSIWDIRKFKEVSNFHLRRPGASVAISDRGLTSIGWGTQATVYKGLMDQASEDAQKVTVTPYLSWGGVGHNIERLRFCPFEDVLGCGHSSGFTSVLVPGAGEPNYDALEINPYETTKQRQEAEVKALLNKLQPDMISLDPNFIGRLDLASHETKMKEKDLDRRPEDEISKLKNVGRGKNSSLRKYLRKKSTKNVIDERREKIQELRRETNRQARVDAGERAETKKEELGPALARFVR